MSYKRENVKRVFHHGMRGENAKRCIGSINPGCDIMGLTKGDFSMIDILQHCLNQVGEADVIIGTWTAGKADIGAAEKMLDNGLIKSLKMLVDRSFPNRQPGYYKSVLQKFGKDSVRLARFHAKFILIKNDNFNICIRTSMNLNENKRIEMYEISDNKEMYGYFKQIVDQHFKAPCEDSYSLFSSIKLETPENKENQCHKTRIGNW